MKRTHLPVLLGIVWLLLVVMLLNWHPHVAVKKPVMPPQPAPASNRIGSTETGEQEARKPSAFVTLMMTAEVQAETLEQSREICRGIKDLSSLPYAELKNKRYANAQGIAGQLEITALINQYLVGVPAVPLSAEELASAVEQSESRTAARMLFQRAACDRVDNK